MRIERVRQAVADKPVRFIAGYIASVIIFGGLIYSLIEAETPTGSTAYGGPSSPRPPSGYGDISPAELEGRFLAGFIILSGIATTAVLTGLLAGWVLSAKFEEHLGTPDLHDDFDHMIGQLQALKQRYRVRRGRRRPDRRGRAGRPRGVEGRAGRRRVRPRDGDARRSPEARVLGKERLEAIHSGEPRPGGRLRDRLQRAAGRRRRPTASTRTTRWWRTRSAATSTPAATTATSGSTAPRRARRRQGASRRAPSSRRRRAKIASTNKAAITARGGFGSSGGSTSGVGRQLGGGFGSGGS